jgi:hypothetical protein
MFGKMSRGGALSVILISLAFIKTCMTNVYIFRINHNPIIRPDPARASMAPDAHGIIEITSAHVRIPQPKRKAISVIPAILTCLI